MLSDINTICFRDDEYTLPSPFANAATRLYRIPRPQKGQYPTYVQPLSLISDTFSKAQAGCYCAPLIHCRIDDYAGEAHRATSADIFVFAISIAIFSTKSLLPSPNLLCFDIYNRDSDAPD